MIPGKLVDILHSEWMRLKTDMLPLWFYNCVTERARERASIHWRIWSSDVLPTATWTGMLKETVTDLLLTHISLLLEHINKLATTEQSPSCKKQLHEKTNIKGINKSHYFFMIYLGIKLWNLIIKPFTLPINLHHGLLSLMWNAEQPISTANSPFHDLMFGWNLHWDQTMLNVITTTKGNSFSWNAQKQLCPCPFFYFIFERWYFCLSSWISALSVIVVNVKLVSECLDCVSFYICL